MKKYLGICILRSVANFKSMRLFSYVAKVNLCRHNQQNSLMLEKTENLKHCFIMIIEWQKKERNKQQYCRYKFGCILMKTVLAGLVWVQQVTTMSNHHVPLQITVTLYD